MGKAVLVPVSMGAPFLSRPALAGTIAIGATTGRLIGTRLHIFSLETCIRSSQVSFRILTYIQWLAPIALILNRAVRSTLVPQLAPLQDSIRPSVEGNAVLPILFMHMPIPQKAPPVSSVIAWGRTFVLSRSPAAAPLVLSLHI